jgi:hypothetical protein
MMVVLMVFSMTNCQGYCSYLEAVMALTDLRIRAVKPKEALYRCGFS